MTRYLTDIKKATQASLSVCPGHFKKVKFSLDAAGNLIIDARTKALRENPVYERVRMVWPLIEAQCRKLEVLEQYCLQKIPLKVEDLQK